MHAIERDVHYRIQTQVEMPSSRVLAALIKEACRAGPLRGAESGSLLDLGERVFCCGPVASPV